MKRKVATTIAVTVNGRAWNRAYSSRNVRPDDAVYVLNRKDGRIRFGDGTHGRRPPVGATISVLIAMAPDLPEALPSGLMARAA